MTRKRPPAKLAFRTRRSVNEVSRKLVPIEHVLLAELGDRGAGRVIPEEEIDRLAKKFGLPSDMLKRLYAREEAGVEIEAAPG